MASAKKITPGRRQMAMLITPAQYTTLATLVGLRMPAAVDANYIANVAGPDLADKMPTSTQISTIARWLVDQVLRQPNPAYFIKVVGIADNGQPGIASLVALADSLSADPSRWMPLDTSRLDWTIDSDPLAIADGRPFVDRRGFRELLPRLGAEATPPCILVTGGAAEGKSYLYDFCRAFMMGREEMKVGYARIPPNAVGNSSLRALAERLALDLDLSFDDQPDEHAEPERDAENLATWIAHYSPERAIPALAILDEFGRPGVSAAHHRFVAMLARRLQDDPLVRARLRLVLIDYERDRLSEAGIEHGHYVLEPIELQHIETWFRMRHPGHADYRYGNAALRISDRLRNLQPTERMERLNNMVRAVSKKFAVA
jgi:hypothetical protein